MHARSVFFLVAILLLGGCNASSTQGEAGIQGPPGPPGDDGEDGEGGTPGEDGEDGTDGTDGDDGSAILSGSVESGSFLSLTHGLGAGNLLYEAQFIKDDRIYDHSDYPDLFGPEYGPAVTLAGGGGIDRDADAALLDNGTLAVLFNEAGRLYLMVADATGGEVVAPIDLGGFDGARDVSALPGGGFVVVWNDLGDAYFVVEFDDAGEQVGDAGHHLATDLGAIEVEALAGGGYAIAYSTGESGGDGSWAEVRSAPNVAISAPVAMTPSEQLSLVALPGGGFGVLARDSDGDDDALSYFTFDAAGALLDELVVLEDYAVEMDTAVAPNGNVLLAFEYGTPDAMGYAVVDEAGAVLHPPTLLSAHEAGAMSAGTFGDGTFVVLTSEDDSFGTEMFVIGTDGARRAPANLVGTVSPRDGRKAVLALEDNRVLLIEVANPGTVVAMTEVSKGYLELRRISDAEVQLHNLTSETLEATVAAHRTP